LKDQRKSGAQHPRHLRAILGDTQPDFNLTEFTVKHCQRHQKILPSEIKPNYKN